MVPVSAREDCDRQDNKGKHAHLAPGEPAQDGHGDTRDQAHQAVDIPRHPVEPRVRSSECIHGLTLVRHAAARCTVVSKAASSWKQILASRPESGMIGRF